MRLRWCSREKVLTSGDICSPVTFTVISVPFSAGAGRVGKLANATDTPSVAMLRTAKIAALSTRTASVVLSGVDRSHIVFFWTYFLVPILFLIFGYVLGHFLWLFF